MSSERNIRAFFKINTNAKQNITALAVCAVFTALSVILDRLLGIHLTAVPVIGAIDINFGFVPILLAGYLFGPLWGGAVGGAMDIICTWLFPLGPYHPGFTFCCILVGFSAGVFVYAAPKLVYKFYGQIPFCVLIGSIVNMLDSIWLSQLYSKIFLSFGYVGLRLVSSLVPSVACGIVTFFIMRYGVTALKKSKLLN